MTSSHSRIQCSYADGWFTIRNNNNRYISDSSVKTHPKLQCICRLKYLCWIDDSVRDQISWFEDMSRWSRSLMIKSDLVYFWVTCDVFNILYLFPFLLAESNDCWFYSLTGLFDICKTIERHSSLFTNCLNLQCQYLSIEGFPSHSVIVLPLFRVTVHLILWQTWK